MKIKSIILYICIILAVIAAILFGAHQYLFSGLKQDETFAEVATHQSERLAVNDEEDFENANIVNIAIFGIDSTDSDEGRSDATMILSIDYEHNKIKLTSIARDTLVYIPDKDVTEKFTHAYAYGGAQLAVKTLNTNFNTNITDYIAVNFSEMAKIIDLVGGVEVDLTEAERQNLPNSENLSVGENITLNGEQAVAYSRIRKIDNDNARTSRQREIMACLFLKARDMSATQYPALIRECLSLCTTSLDYSELPSFSQILLQKDLSLEQFSLPGDSVDAWGGIMSSSGAWCYVYDLREASDALLTFIYESIYTNSNIELPPATVDKSAVN